MPDRRFDTGDPVNDYNLRRLEHLSRNDARGGDVRVFEINIHAALDSLEMLPAAVRRHFPPNVYVGDYHRPNDAWRETTWTEVAAGLDVALTAVHDDATLRSGSGTTLNDRPVSRGELIAEICKKLEAIYDRGGSWDPALAELERASTGTTVRSEVEAMKRLINRKRVPDVGAWRSELIGLIWRAHNASQRLHHLRGPA